MDKIENELSKALVEIFGRDLPEQTNIYCNDK